MLYFRRIVWEYSLRVELYGLVVVPDVECVCRVRVRLPLQHLHGVDGEAGPQAVGGGGVPRLGRGGAGGREQGVRVVVVLEYK